MREGLPDAVRRGNQWRGLFWAPKRHFRPAVGPNRLPIRGARLSLGHDRPFPVPEHLCGAAGELFRPRGADPRRRPPADQAEPGAGGPARARSGRCWRARKGAEILAGKRIPEGADPIAMAYAGHQFGHFVPQLGDGRAILLGEVIDADGVRRDIQLKGSGPTPFSRRGDGRAALGPVLREYIVSEAMSALGIPTTRSLAAVTTGEQCCARRCCPAPCSLAWRRATSASAPSSSLPRAATPTACGARRPRHRQAFS